MTQKYTVMSRSQRQKVEEKNLQPYDISVRVPDEVRERAFVLWATVGARNANAVRGLLELEADEGEQVPSASAIRKWSAQWNWAARADFELGDTSALTMKELERKYRAIMLGGADVLLRAQTGGYKGRVNEGLLAVKATEIGMAVLKDKFFVGTERVKTPAVEGKVLSREEEESNAQQAMIQRGNKRKGR